MFSIHGQRNTSDIGRLCIPQADGSDTKVKEKATLPIELQLFVVQPNITSPALHMIQDISFPSLPTLF